MTNSQSAFFYYLFVALRRADFPLGLDDYLTALRAVEAGFGLADEATLYRLCSLLWLKTERQEPQFKRIFQEQLERTAKAIEHEKLSQQAPDVPRPLPPPKRDDHRSQTSSESEIETDSPKLTGKTKETTTALNFNEAISQIQLDKQTIEQAPRTRYWLKPTNLPVTLRQMKRMWHYLRRYRRTGPATELDVTATIKQISQLGYLNQPVLVPRRTNQVGLMLLLDQAGSMVPFHLFSKQLVESAQRGGRLAESGVYYFHNIPLRHLYTDQARLHGIELPHLFDTLPPGLVVMIFSDAGAARQSYNIDRILQTETFLTQLAQKTLRQVWVNPLPNDRWPGTSAAEIARLIPMFELSRPGLDAAITALNGQGIYWEKIYSWML